MNTNIEKEYKILLSKEQFQQLVNKYNNLDFIKQVNFYFDTPDLQIRKQKGSMRIREKEQHFLFTLKKHTAEGLLELEKELPGSSLQDLLEDNEVQELLKEYHLTCDLVLLTSLTTYRAVITTAFAEICFDHNMYHDKEDFEIEYEYKKDHQGLILFQELLDTIGVVYEKNCTSKSKRALQCL